MTIPELNSLKPQDAATELAKCCGALKWVEQMLLARPFSTQEGLLTAAQQSWQALAPQDWLEAFSQHPAIGKIETSEPHLKSTRSWAREEQKGVRAAPENILQELADENQVYEKRFGHVFLVCATGKTAEEMLALLRIRIQNTPEVELHTAAQEQMKITRIRLEKLLTL